MVTLKRALVCGTALVATLVVVEVVARVYDAIADGERHDAVPTDAQAASHGREGSGERRHPYTAFTTGTASDERNSHPPHPGGSGTLVVGVFGGGMAADMTPVLKLALAARLSDLGVDIEPVVLGFAQGGGRQPQQLMAAINRLVHGARLDAMVNLDGLHEMNWRRDKTLDHFPRSPATTAAELRLMSEIVARRERQQQLLATRHGALGVSAAFGIFMDRRLDDLQSDLRQLEDRLALLSAGYLLERDGPRRGWSAHRQLAGAARQWYRSSLLLAEIAKDVGADYYHFLQPDRHVQSARQARSAERASAEEHRQATGERSAPGHPYATMHAMLAELGLDLARHGVAFFDLAGTFATDDGVLYEDECCRLTQRGRELLAASVLRHIAPTVDALRRTGEVAPGRTEFGSARTVVDELLASAHYDVYRRGSNRLVYKRAGCADDDTREPFFLHVTPLHGDDLDPRAKDLGFENRDFDFLGNVGVRVGERCIVEQRLPDYPIDYLRTGQYDATTHERHWLAWVKLNATTAPFDVFLRARGVLYRKRDCSAKDVRLPFFLHVLAVPEADDVDLPATLDGYVNMDFKMSFADVVQGDGSCVFGREVPFAFRQLRTGQYDADTVIRVWQRDIPRA